MLLPWPILHFRQCTSILSGLLPVLQHHVLYILHTLYFPVKQTGIVANVTFFLGTFWTDLMGDINQAVDGAAKIVNQVHLYAKKAFHALGYYGNFFPDDSSVLFFLHQTILTICTD